MKICIDGNRGTGKTTLVAILKQMMPQHQFQDCGLPIAMTVGETAEPADLYFILHCPVELCLHRLKEAGRECLPETLGLIQQELFDLARKNGWRILDASFSTVSLANQVSAQIKNKLNLIGQDVYIATVTHLHVPTSSVFISEQSAKQYVYKKIQQDARYKRECIKPLTDESKQELARLIEEDDFEAVEAHWRTDTDERVSVVKCLITGR